MTSSAAHLHCYVLIFNRFFFKQRAYIGICVPPTLVSRLSHHFSGVCLPLSHLLGSASTVCPSCVCLTFDIHRFNKHQTFTGCQRHPWPRLSPTGSNVTTLTLMCLCMRICMPNIQVCMYSMNKSLCQCGQARVCVCTPHSPTFGGSSARHLEPPLSPVTHTQDLPPVPPTHPPQALSLTCQINC